MNVTETSAKIEAGRFRRVLGHYPTGVAAITAIGDDGNPVGMTVGSFTSVSLDPPLVAFLPDKSSSSFPLIRKSGSFCVNVLGADQQQVCRNFAAKGADRFKGLSWHPASSKSPILDGVVAWIDCDIDTVHDSGDHYIVIGRVRELETAGGDLPLLFFQGGYGEFSSPWKTAPAAPDLRDHLRLVDSWRDSLVNLASELNLECIASTLVDDELVMLGSAGKPGRRLLHTVGQRVPVQAPIAIPLVAFSDTPAIEAWIAKAKAAHPQADHDLYRTMVDRVQRRGWSLALASEAQLALEAAVARLASPSPTDEQRADVRRALGALAASREYEPEVISAEGEYRVRHVSAPVVDVDGHARFAVNLYGFPEVITGAELRRYIRQLTECVGTLGAGLEAGA
ncbi:MAG: flavin reductase [Hyphomicrobiales bacterium]|nr:MAG: flavin reductase [Hyphomicrobiales bacterium]